MNSLDTPRYLRLLERLRAARRDAGLTQIDVARAFGKPQSFVSKCELGERRIDVVELGQFASLYRKPLAYFVGDGESAASTVTAHTPDSRRGSAGAPPLRKDALD